MEPLAVVRLLSVFGGMLLLVSVADFTRYLPGSNNNSDRWVLFLVAFHPMIWIYSNNATADVLPAGLVLAALVCCLRAHTLLRWHFLGISFFSLACVVKFNSVLLGAGFVVILIARACNERRQRLMHTGVLLVYIFMPITTLTVYFTWIYQKYGIIFLPEQFKSVHTFSTSIMQRFMSLILYYDFLVLFSGPLGLILFCSLFERKNKQFHLRVPFAATIILAMFLSLYLRFLGEMNFGGLENLLPLSVVTLVHAVGVAMVFMLIRFYIDATCCVSDRSVLGLLAAVIVPYLLISAMSRPAQRYLIMILPFVMVWLVHATWQFRPAIARSIMLASFVMFFCLTAVGAIYLRSQAFAADRMGQWIVGHKLNGQTDPGILVSHLGYLFPLQPPARPVYRLEILSKEPEVTPPKIIHQESVHIGPFLVKRFVLLSALNTGS
jgi:hypothetical protein